MTQSNVPNVSSVAQIRERLLARTVNGQSRFTTAEMTALIEQRLARARAPISPERLETQTRMVEDNKNALARLNSAMRQRGLRTRYVDAGGAASDSPPPAPAP